MTARLAEPWALLAAVPLAALWWRRLRLPRPAARWSALALFDFPDAGAGRTRWEWCPAALRAAWLALAVLALARPLAGRTAPHAAPLLVVALDASGSMGAHDDQPAPRLERAKAAARTAAEAWPGDLALVAFAAAARPRCLPTADRADFRRTLDAVALADDDNRTDLGGGLAASLELFDERSGAVLLLTDGAQRLAEGASPLEMARVAESLGVLVHAAGLGDFAGPYAADGANLLRLTAIARGSCAFEPLAEGWFRALPPPPPGGTTISWHELAPWLARGVAALMLLEWLLRRTWLRVRPDDG